LGGRSVPGPQSCMVMPQSYGTRGLVKSLFTKESLIQIDFEVISYFPCIYNVIV
jgi:hypothetical protein